MRHDRDRQATRIGDDMALAALDLLARVIAASVGFTDRLSMTPAGGAALATGRLARLRHRMKIDRRPHSFIPSSRHRWKYP